MGRPQRLWSLALLGCVIFTTGAEPAAMALPPTFTVAQLNSPHDASTARLPRSVARQVRRDLAQRLNLPRRDFQIASFDRQTWSDSCLGLAAPNERCAMAMVEGWRVEVTNGQQSWFYRTDLTAQIVKLEGRDDANLPPDVNNSLPSALHNRLLQTAAQELRLPAATLKITEAQPQIFDGCMGIYEPEQFCTKIAISGYRVIVSGESQSWIYHISENGSRIIQNTTASGSRGELVPSFIPADSQQPPSDEDQTIVFRLSMSGGLAGMVSESVLLSDGTVYRRDWRPNDPRV
ncbi:MAG: hypothetical protein HC772_09430, partial [Leptolyngbyaceae cyanobacterium CRU_2_3]|nr:hypothetical protein [Leptolyngbyaceae cyanobacterium CRU_2_3]